MRLPAAARRQPLNQLRQLPRRLEPAVLALPRYRPRKPPRIPLAAQFPKNLRQLFRARLVHQLGRRQRLPPVHPHVQRPVLLEAEPALSLVQLRRTHTQIQQHPVATARRHPVRQFRKIALADFKPPGKLRQPSARAASTAAPSRSHPYNHPVGELAANMAAACPAPPTVPSAYRPPGSGLSAASTSATITGLCVNSGTAHRSSSVHVLPAPKILAVTRPNAAFRTAHCLPRAAAAAGAAVVWPEQLPGPRRSSRFAPL